MSNYYFLFGLKADWKPRRQDKVIQSYSHDYYHLALHAGYVFQAHLSIIVVLVQMFIPEQNQIIGLKLSKSPYLFQAFQTYSPHNLTSFNEFLNYYRPIFLSLHCHHLISFLNVKSSPKHYLHLNLPQSNTNYYYYWNFIFYFILIQDKDNVVQVAISTQRTSKSAQI